jgi:hypothetical protein
MSRDNQTDAHLIQIVLVCGGAGFVIGLIALGIVPAIIFAIMFSGIGFGVYRVMVVGSARMAGSLLVPDDRGGHSPGYSHIEALEAKGDFTAALEAWERVVVETPDALAPRIHAADLYARKAKNPARAAELFRSVQAHPQAPDDTLRYVSQRLIDLLLGPLNDEGRALVELRKVADRWPGTPEGNGARAAIARIKSTRPS